jgi:hypothetical protein
VELKEARIPYCSSFRHALRARPLHAAAQRQTVI